MEEYALPRSKAEIYLRERYGVSVHRQTLWSWARKYGVGRQLANGRWYYSIKKLDAFINGKKPPGPPPVMDPLPAKPSPIRRDEDE